MKQFKQLCLMGLFVLLCSTVDAQTFDTPGSFTFTATEAGTYTIEARGANGGDRAPTRLGGQGATVIGDFTLNAGDELDIYVGEAGGNSSPGILGGGGGGGGTAVILNDTEVLVAAAGAGGGSNSGQGFGGLVDFVDCTPNCGGGPIAFGGSGGGFNQDGAASSFGALPEPGGAGTLTGMGIGGSGNGEGGKGGDGWGAGGGGSQLRNGGGGGGYKGGQGSPTSNVGGYGGDSFFNNSLGTLTSSTAGANGGGGGTNGHVIITVGETTAAVPTMGEWALIIFGLIIMSIGAVSVIRWNKSRNVELA